MEVLKDENGEKYLESQVLVFDGAIPSQSHASKP